MATASPTAISAVPDRPLAARSECKGTAAPDGRFADLMAQLAPAQTTPSKPALVAASPVKAPKRPQVQPGGTQATAARPAEGSAAPHKAEAAERKTETPIDKPEASKAGRDAQSANADDPTPRVQGPRPAAAPLNPSADTANPELPTSDQIQPTSALPQAVVPPLVPLPVPPGAMLPPDLGEAPTGTDAGPKSQPPASTGPASTHTASSQTPGAAPMASALPSAQVLLGLPTPASQDQEATASNPGSLRFTTLTDQAQAPPVVQPGSSPAQPGPAAEVSALQPSTAAQAVLAESGASWKAASKPDDSSSPAEPLNASKASTADKATKTLDLQSIAQAPLLAPMKDAGDPTTLGKAQPPDAGPDKANVQPSTNPSATVFMTEALAAKPAPPPAPRAADGSELAALSALSRTTEPAAVAATSAPLAAAPPPSAPVLQIEGGLKWMLKGGAQEAELQLHPDSLGKVTIHLRVEDGQVHARLWVTEPGSVQAVQEGRPHLEQSLKEQGLQLGSFDLQQGNRPFQEAPSASSSREPVVLEATSARQEAPVALPVSILNPHHVELYA